MSIEATATYHTTQHRRANLIALVLLLIAVLLSIVGLGVGSTGFESVWNMWTSSHTNQNQQHAALQIIFDIRAPRTLGALLAGALLGLSGALASLVTIVSPEILPAMQAFMLGTSAYVGWIASAVMFAVLLPCLLVSWVLSKALDALSLGEATAMTLGIPLSTLRMVLIVLMALASGTAVAQTGLIAFVGLVSPHLVRSMVKVTHGRMLLLSSLMGGVLLMLADIFGRSLIAPQELPVGVLTAILGGGYLLWLMNKRTL